MYIRLLYTRARQVYTDIFTSKTRNLVYLSAPDYTVAPLMPSHIDSLYCYLYRSVSFYIFTARRASIICSPPLLRFTRTQSLLRKATTILTELSTFSRNIHGAAQLHRTLTLCAIFLPAYISDARFASISGFYRSGSVSATSSVCTGTCNAFLFALNVERRNFTLNRSCFSSASISYLLRKLCEPSAKFRFMTI